MIQHTIGDTPRLTGTAPANLAGASIKVNVKTPDGTIAESDVATPGSPTTSAEDGGWTATFGAGDLDQHGWHELEVRVKYSSGDIETFVLDGDDAVMSFETRIPFGTAPA